MQPDYALKDLADRVGGSVVGDETVRVAGLCALDEPRPGCIAFTAERSTRAIADVAGGTGIAALLIQQDAALPDNFPISCIRTKDPQRALLQLVPLFYAPPAEPREVSPKADIHPSARLGHNAAVGAFAVIGPDVVIEDDVTIHPHVTVYRGARLGRGAVVHAGAVVREHCVLEPGVVIQNGAVIGADGFGYLPGPDGALQPVPQIGITVLERNVEVGANACIDRAALGTTRVGMGTKIDNQVQIGHNVKIGKHCVLCGQTGVAGSAVVGNHVVMGARVGAIGHLQIVDGCRFAAATEVYESVTERGDYAGSPAVPHIAHKRRYQLMKNLPSVIRDLKQSIKRLDEKDG